MANAKTLPVALTVAGSDSGGGAGIQADLKTFDQLGVHGTSAITCLTAQNPARVLGIEPCSPRFLRLQLEAVWAELPPAAAKTGMLYSAALISVAADFFRKRPVPLVVDPVMVSTSGARLLQPPALKKLKAELFPLATLLTPNLQEAELLVGGRIRSRQDLGRAARAIYAEFGCAALVKGGHLRGVSKAVDVFFDGSSEFELSSPWVRGVSTHGTGCTLSAAIAANLALGRPLTRAVRRAKDFVTVAIQRSARVGSHLVLGKPAASTA